MLPGHARRAPQVAELCGHKPHLLAKAHKASMAGLHLIHAGQAEQARAMRGRRGRAGTPGTPGRSSRPGKPDKARRAGKASKCFSSSELITFSGGNVFVEPERSQALEVRLSFNDMSEDT